MPLCGFLFTPIVGLTCAVANIVLAKLAQSNSETTWIPLNEKTVEEIKIPWIEDGEVFATIQIIYGIFFSIFQISVNQVAIQWMRLSTTTIWEISYVFSYACILAPIIEEIVFRGFLQEKIKDIQVLCFGKEAANSFINKIVRIALQALAFGLVHYHALQGLFNIVVVIMTGLIGFSSGFLKEETNALGASISYHSLINTGVFGRVLVFGT